jgi:hypothetical protein
LLLSPFQFFFSFDLHKRKKLFCETTDVSAKVVIVITTHPFTSIDCYRGYQPFFKKDGISPTRLFLSSILYINERLFLERISTSQRPSQKSTMASAGDLETDSLNYYHDTTQPGGVLDSENNTPTVS